MRKKKKQKTEEGRAQQRKNGKGGEGERELWVGGCSKEEGREESFVHQAGHRLTRSTHTQTQTDRQTERECFLPPSLPPVRLRRHEQADQAEKGEEKERKGRRSIDMSPFRSFSSSLFPFVREFIRPSFIHSCIDTLMHQPVIHSFTDPLPPLSFLSVCLSVDESVGPRLVLSCMHKQTSAMKQVILSERKKKKSHAEGKKKNRKAEGIPRTLCAREYDKV